MQKCEFNSTKITLLYGHYSGNIQHICSKTPFLENTSGKLLLCTIFNIDVINVEVLHKQVKCYTGIKPCLTLNEIFIRPEAAIVVDKTRKRYGIYMRFWYLNCHLCAGLHTSLVAQQHLRRTYTYPLVFKGLKQYRVQYYILTISKRN